MDIEALLQPISPEDPCGEDLSYDVSFNELETLVRGKEETQFSAAEEPDWKLIRDRCVELLGRSKDLRVAVTLCLALLKIEGMSGVRDGLSLLHGLLTNYWDGVYPRLDPDDNNDPTERMNVIAGLTKPLGTFGDPVRFLERLRQVPLANSSRVGRMTLADVTQVGLPAGTEKPAPQPAEIEAAFKDTSSDAIDSLSIAVGEARQLLEQIDTLLTDAVGADRAPNLEALGKTLKEVDQTVRPYVKTEVPAGVEGLDDVLANFDSPAPQAGSQRAAVAGASLSGPIGSREDVVRVLEQVCEYYAGAEPSSPVPILLRRAQRLVHLDFLQLMEDLAPDALGQISVIAGRSNGSSASVSEETPAEE